MISSSVSSCLQCDDCGRWSAAYAVDPGKIRSYLKRVKGWRYVETVDSARDVCSTCMATERPLADV